MELLQLTWRRPYPKAARGYNYKVERLYLKAYELVQSGFSDQDGDLEPAKKAREISLQIVK